MEFLTENSILLIILFVAPGFVSLKIWGLIYPSQKTLISESLVEAIIFSSFNYIATIWMYVLLKDTHFVWVYYVCFLLLPFLWPIFLKAILSTKLLKEKTISPIPKSWDYFFFRRKECFMLIHLNNERIIGGLYGAESFASSYPEEEDVYLQEVWKIDEEGRFMERIPGAKGLLVNHDDIEYIELFDTNGGKGNE